MDRKENYNTTFTVSYQKYKKMVICQLNRLIYNWDTSHELSQDIFTRLYEQGVPLNPDSGRTVRYLQRIARNRGIDYLRKRELEMKKLRHYSIDEVEINDRFYESLEDTYLRGEVISTIHDSINTFPEKSQEVFTDKYFFDMSDRAISIKNRVSIYKIKKMYTEMEKFLKLNLTEYFD